MASNMSQEVTTKPVGTTGRARPEIFLQSRVCVKMLTDMCVDMCVDMRIDMRIDVYCGPVALIVFCLFGQKRLTCHADVDRSWQSRLYAALASGDGQSIQNEFIANNLSIIKVVYSCGIPPRIPPMRS